MLLPDLDSELPPAAAGSVSTLREQAAELTTLVSLNPTACLQRATELLEAAREAGDMVCEMQATYYLAATRVGRSEFAEAERLMRRAHGLSSACGDPVWQAKTLAGVGILFAHQAAYDQALEWLGVALEQYRAIHHKPGIADCISNLASVLSALEMHSEALPMLHEARSIDLELGNTANAAVMLWMLAQYHADLAVRARRQGDTERERDEALRTRDLLHQALREDRTAVHPYVEAGGLLALGNANLVLGEIDAVQQALDSLDTVLGSYPIPARQIDRNLLQARLERSQGRLDRACRLLDETWASCAEHAIETGEHIDTLEELADTREALGDYAGALGALRQFHAAQQKVGSAAARHRAKLLAQHLQAVRERHRSEVQAVLDRRAQLRDTSPAYNPTTG
jgi:tetratricopeptide (TPR) repeat protein